MSLLRKSATLKTVEYYIIYYRRLSKNVNDKLFGKQMIKNKCM